SPPAPGWRYGHFSAARRESAGRSDQVPWSASLKAQYSNIINFVSTILLIISKIDNIGNPIAPQQAYTELNLIAKIYRYQRIAGLPSPGLYRDHHQAAAPRGTPKRRTRNVFPQVFVFSPCYGDPHARRPIHQISTLCWCIAS